MSEKVGFNVSFRFTGHNRFKIKLLSCLSELRRTKKNPPTTTIRSFTASTELSNIWKMLRSVFSAGQPDCRWNKLQTESGKYSSDRLRGRSSSSFSGGQKSSLRWLEDLPELLSGNNHLKRVLHVKYLVANERTTQSKPELVGFKRPFHEWDEG